MKKIAAIVLVLCLVFAFAACGDEDTTSKVTSSKAVSSSQEAEPIIYAQGEWPNGPLGSMLPKPKAGELMGGTETETTVDTTIGVGAKVGEYFAALQEAGFDKNVQELTEGGVNCYICENETARVTLKGSGTSVSVKLETLASLEN